jgi:hypothetical protein
MSSFIRSAFLQILDTFALCFPKNTLQKMATESRMTKDVSSFATFCCS